MDVVFRIIHANQIHVFLGYLVEKLEQMIMNVEHVLKECQETACYAPVNKTLFQFKCSIEILYNYTIYFVILVVYSNS